VWIKRFYKETRLELTTFWQFYRVLLIFSPNFNKRQQTTLIFQLAIILRYRLSMEIILKSTPSKSKLLKNEIQAGLITNSQAKRGIK
jgi:hypothetical protein